MICSIYKISNNFDSRVYIGQTWKDISIRFKRHKYENSGCHHLKSAFRRYGMDNFKIELITFAHTQEIADYWESYFINKYNSVNDGFNIRSGGSKGILGIETRQKLSKSLLGRQSNSGSFKIGKLRNDTSFKKGITPWITGKKHTQETCMKITGKKSKLKFTVIEIKEMILMYQRGYTMVEISEKFHCNRHSVSKYLKGNK